MGKAALQVLSLVQSQEWDNVVRSFQNYDIYYLSGYVKAFQLHGDGEPLLFYYDDGKNRGINVAMKRDIRQDDHFKGILTEDRFYDLATPYGYGGWIVEGDTEQLFRDYERWCLGNQIISEFVRFHPMLENQKVLHRHYDIVGLGNTVAMELTSPEVIWENISSKNRNMIRKAIRNEVRIYHGNHPDLYRQFQEIYEETMDKDEAAPYYYFGQSFYQSLIRDLPGNAQVFWAEKDGTMIAASIMLEANGFMNYHLSGSRRQYSQLAPTNLLLYQAALWGYEHGFRTLYLGGGVGSGEDSLFRFKRAFFRGELHPFYIGRKVFSQEQYQELTLMRGNSIQNTRYFPEYRG